MTPLWAKSGDTNDTPAFNIDAGKLAEEAHFVFVLDANAKMTLLQPHDMATWCRSRTTQGRQKPAG